VLCFDARYAAASKPPAADGGVLILQNGSAAPADARQLQAQVQRLQRELTSKEQDLMELRSKVK